MRQVIYKLLLALACLAPLAVRAQTVPSLPELFYGTAPGTEGSEVDAFANNLFIASTTLSGGTYGYAPHLLLIEASPGAVVTFEVAGAKASQSAPFSSGAITRLDLGDSTTAQSQSSIDDVPSTDSIAVIPGLSTTMRPAAPSTSVQKVPTLPPRPLQYDLTGDRKVNANDLGYLLAHWGANGAHTPADINKDGVTNVLDFTLLIAHWSL